MPVSPRGVVSPKSRRNSALAANGLFSHSTFTLQRLAHSWVCTGIDITHELKIEAKRKELNIKQEGRTQLQKHVDTLRDNSQRKAARPAASELEERLRRQQERAQAEGQGQIAQTNVSELHMAFRLRASTKREVPT